VAEPWQDFSLKWLEQAIDASGFRRQNKDTRLFAKRLHAADGRQCAPHPTNRKTFHYSIDVLDRSWRQGRGLRAFEGDGVLELVEG